MEPGLITLAKIIGTLLVGVGTIPLLFLLASGDPKEPEESFDEDHH